MSADFAAQNGEKREREKERKVSSKRLTYTTYKNFSQKKFCQKREKK
jgi:hypothetical protein